jgi:hypothetical protein
VRKAQGEQTLRHLQQVEAKRREVESQSELQRRDEPHIERRQSEFFREKLQHQEQPRDPDGSPVRAGAVETGRLLSARSDRDAHGNGSLHVEPRVSAFRRAPPYASATLASAKLSNPIDEDTDPLERSLAHDSHFVSIKETDRHGAFGFRQVSSDGRAENVGSSSPRRSRLRHEVDEMDAFVETWQKSHGLNGQHRRRVARERPAQGPKRPGEASLEGLWRPEGQGDAAGVHESALRGESSVTFLTPEQLRSDHHGPEIRGFSQWLSSESAGLEKYGSGVLLPDAPAPSIPLSPLSQLLQNHRSTQPEVPRGQSIRSGQSPSFARTPGSSV